MSFKIAKPLSIIMVVGMMLSHIGWQSALGKNQARLAYYSISGRIIDVEGDPLSNVTVQIMPELRTIHLPMVVNSSASSGLAPVQEDQNHPEKNIHQTAMTAFQVTTNSNGEFSRGNLPAGNYTITPGQSGYSFTPFNSTVTIPPSTAGQDFTRHPGEMVLIPAGEFQMGCHPDHNYDYSCEYTDVDDDYSDELPLHTVYLDNFLISTNTRSPTSSTPSARRIPHVPHHYSILPTLTTPIMTTPHTPITRWFGSPGTTRRITAPGPVSACPPKPSGRKLPGVPPCAPFLGATRIQPATWPTPGKPIRLRTVLETP